MSRISLHIGLYMWMCAMALAGLVFGMVSYSRAAFAPLPGTPFGGQILSINECACSQGFQIVVGPPRPSMTLVRSVPATVVGAPGIYEFMAPHPDAWTLGLQVPCDICRSGAFCVPVGATTGEVGACGIMGTSL